MRAMALLPEIPLEHGSPLALLQRQPDKARDLAAAAAGTFGLASRAAAALAAPLADCLSRDWLLAQDNPFLPEIDAIAATLRIPGVHALNVCFEWGCTSGVWPAPVARCCAG